MISLGSPSMGDRNGDGVIGVMMAVAAVEADVATEHLLLNGWHGVIREDGPLAAISESS